MSLAAIMILIFAVYYIQQPGQSYSYEPTGYASSSLAAAPSAAGYAQSDLSQPQYAVQGIHILLS